MAEELGRILVNPKKGDIEGDSPAQNIGNFIGQGLQSVNQGIVQPMLDANAQMFYAGLNAVKDLAVGVGQGFMGNAEASSSKKSKSESTQPTGGGIPSPATDPVGFTNAAILTAILPQIVNHAAEAYQQTGQVPDSTQILSQLIASKVSQNQLAQQNQQNNQVQQQTQPQAQTQQQASPNANILQQAGVKQGLLSRLTGQNLNPEYVQQQLGNIASAQQVLGKEPLQEAEVGRAGLAVKQKVAEAEQVPLTQAEQATLQAGYSKQITEQRDKSMARLDDTIKQLQEYRQQVWDKSNFLGKGKKVKEIDEQLKKLQEIRAYHMQENFDRDIPSARKSTEKSTEKYSEEDIQHTLKLHPEYTREKLLKALGK